MKAKTLGQCVVPKGDLQYIELKSGKLFNALELERIVGERMTYLRTRGALRPAPGSPTNGGPDNNDFSEAFRLARMYDLR